MKNEQGLTLVEVIAAVALISLVIVMYMNLSGYSRQSDQSSDLRTIANQRIETMSHIIRYDIQQLATSERQNFENAEPIVNSNRFNKTENNFTYLTEIRPSNSASFTKKCTNGLSSSSISSMVYLADEPQPNTYIVTITSCWSD